MEIAKINSISWASIAKVSGVIKSMIRKIGNSVTHVIAWVFRNTQTYYVQQVIQIDDNTLLLISGPTSGVDYWWYWDSTQYLRKVNKDTLQIITSTPAPQNTVGWGAVDGDWYWQGSYVGYNTGWGMVWCIKHTDWTGFKSWSPHYHCWPIWTIPESPYVFIGTSYVERNTYIVKASKTLYQFSTSYDIWAGCYDGNLDFWCASQYGSHYFLKVSTSGTPTVVAIISRPQNDAVNDMVYDPNQNCIWAPSHGGTGCVPYMYRIDVATNQLTYFSIPQFGFWARYENGKVYYISQQDSHEYVFDTTTHQTTDKGLIDPNHANIRPGAGHTSNWDDRWPMAFGPTNYDTSVYGFYRKQ